MVVTDFWSLKLGMRCDSVRLQCVGLMSSRPSDQTYDHQTDVDTRQDCEIHIVRAGPARQIRGNLELIYQLNVELNI